jgi:hypothetical protein
MQMKDLMLEMLSISMDTTTIINTVNNNSIIKFNSNNSLDRHILLTPGAKTTILSGSPTKEVPLLMAVDTEETESFLLPNLMQATLSILSSRESHFKTSQLSLPLPKPLYNHSTLSTQSLAFSMATLEATVTQLHHPPAQHLSSLYNPNRYHRHPSH